MPVNTSVRPAIRLYAAVFAALVISVSSASVFGAAPEIWMPRQHAPSFAEPSGTFTAEVRAASTLATTGWSASIKKEELDENGNVIFSRTWNCTVTAAATGLIHHDSENGWKLTIQVPANAPPELFTLNVSHIAAGTASSIRAIKIVPDLEANFYIIQVSDQHVVGEEANQPNGMYNTAGSAEAMGWTAEAVNILNPRFFAATGDNVTIYWEGRYVATGGLDAAL